MDTLGEDILCFIERLSSLWKLKFLNLGPQSVSFTETFLYCSLYSECPLSGIVQVSSKKAH